MLRPFPRCYFAFHKWPAHIQFRQLRLHRLNTRNFHVQNWWNFNDKNHLENFSEKILLGCTVELHGPKTNLTSFAEIPLRKHVQCSSIVSIYDGSGTMWNWKIIGWENWWFDNSHYTHIAIHTHTAAQIDANFSCIFFTKIRQLFSKTWINISIKKKSPANLCRDVFSSSIITGFLLLLQM